MPDSTRRQFIQVDDHLLGIVEGDYPESPGTYLGGLLKEEGGDLVLMTCRAAGPVGVSFEVRESLPAVDESQVSVAFDWTPRFDRMVLRAGTVSMERVIPPAGWLRGQLYRTVLRGYGREGWDSVRGDRLEHYEFLLLPAASANRPEVVRLDPAASALTGWRSEPGSQ